MIMLHEIIIDAYYIINTLVGEVRTKRGSEMDFIPYTSSNTKRNIAASLLAW